MPTIHTREELCTVLIGASTREEVEAANKAFDEWLQLHPKDNSVESPVWTALGVLTRKKGFLDLDEAEGVDSEKARRNVEKYVADILAS